VREVKDSNFHGAPLSAKTRQQPPLQKPDTTLSQDHEQLSNLFIYLQVSKKPAS